MGNMGKTNPRPGRSVITTLLSAQSFDATTTSKNSSSVDCSRWRKFLLYLNVDSTLTPTDIRFIPQFSDDAGTTWFDYKQGLFASLYYEDADTASGITECFSGDVVGRLFRLRAVATGTSAANKFTVTATVEFQN